jgi:hypothetical protein
MALLPTTLIREKLEARFAKGWIRSNNCALSLLDTKILKEVW